MKRQALLALEDGTTYRGEAFGADGESFGEVVFNTALTGYQEVLSDPSYCGQLVVMTAPEIGNVGMNREDEEALRPAFSGFVVHELAPTPSSWRAESTVDAYLAERGIVGIAGIDTRALTRRLRTAGSQRGAISTTTLDPAELIDKVRRSPGMEGRDLVREVTCAAPFAWDEPSWVPPEDRPGRHVPPADLHVVAYDFGMKRNILHRLRDHGCRVTVVPATTSGADALAYGADGYFLSNGPGDPDAVPYARENVAKLVGKVPIFGICLGHQILGLALGGRTFKLKFGHHGANHPVKDMTTGKVEITSQNHGFAVDVESLRGLAELSHVNLNDQTVEGLTHTTEPLFSVQYHPEASPGPHDAHYLFHRFIDLMSGQRE